jgi:hypothetical protein
MSQPNTTDTLQGKGMIRGATWLAPALWTSGLAGAAPAASGAAPALATATATAQVAPAPAAAAPAAPAPAAPVTKQDGTVVPQYSIQQFLATTIWGGARVESDEIVAAARRRGTPVEYVIFPNEGHGFARQESQGKAGQAMLDFLLKYMPAAGGPDGVAAHAPH